MLFRTLMMLSGDGAKGTLRLNMENGGLRAAVAITGLPKDGDYGIYLFTDEEKGILAGQLKNGEWQGFMNLRQDVRACGIVRNDKGAEVVVMTGETGDFDWGRAKSAMYLKRSRAPRARMEFPAPEPVPVKVPENVYAAPAPVPEPEPAGSQPEEAPERAGQEEAPAPFEAQENTLEGVYDMATQSQAFTSSLEFQEPEKFLDAVKESSDEEEGLFQRAREAFEESKEDACENCPLTVRKSPIKPFEKQYMDYAWEKTEYPGLQGYWHYITGKQYENGVLKKIAIGVPGDYALNPPNWLYGFNTYAYADEGDVKGYWLLFEDA
jgi:hypothetical protein